jgi:hypothetical protein
VAGGGSSLPGDGGLATAALLSYPSGVITDNHHNLVFADDMHNTVRVVAASTGTFYGQPMTSDHIYTIAGGGSGHDGGPAVGAVLALSGSGIDRNVPLPGLALDAAGDLLIADVGDDSVRMVAETMGTHFGVAMTVGDIYTVAGDGTPGFAGDSGPARTAKLFEPYGTNIDHNGNLVIADFLNHRVRVVATTTGTFYGQAMTANDIYTVAGNGSGTYNGDGVRARTAAVVSPTGVLTDNAGNLIIGELNDSRVRMVAATSGSFFGVAASAGDIYTIAGDGMCGYSGDGGPATAAQTCGPGALALDSAGAIIFGDTFSHRVRRILP